MNKWRRDCLPRRLKEGRCHQEDNVLVETGEMRKGMKGVSGGRGNGGRGDGGGSGTAVVAASVEGAVCVRTWYIREIKIQITIYQALKCTELC